MPMIRLLCVVVLCSAALAQQPEKPKKVSYLDPAAAPADFAFQGEYVGEIAGKKLAAQVISLGNGKFLAAFLPGGLPGEGYEGKSRSEVEGTLQNKEAVFPQGKAGYQAVIAGDALKGQDAGGQPFSLKKVIRKSPAEGAKAPEGATVLFDGTDTGKLDKLKIDDQKRMMVGAITKQAYKNFTLHAEFMLPYMPASDSQSRGNSGLYLQQRYEMQILDSFGRAPEFNGCGSLYRQRAPAINMTFPPLSWQTYDITFKAAEFEGGKKTKNARITVKLNGVVVHDDVEITAKTGAGQAEAAEPRPILFQDHGDPVVFRNVWILEGK